MNGSSRRAPPVPEINQTESSTQSLIDVDSPHISSVPSDFESQSVQTDTQADRLEREAEAEQRRAEAQHSKEKKHEAKRKSQAAGKRIKQNANNPVILGNFVAVGALGTLLGIGAYRKYTAGELTWKIAGLWAGAVGLFAAGDYYLSQYVILAH